MMRRVMLALASAVLLASWASQAEAQQPQPVGVWGGGYASQNWERFYHYPYVYYPQNFWSHEYYQSAQDMYHRYPQEMRVPVYNKQWQNYYPAGRRYHMGHHFILDVF